MKFCSKCGELLATDEFEGCTETSCLVTSNPSETEKLIASANDLAIKLNAAVEVAGKLMVVCDQQQARILELEMLLERVVRR